MSTKPDGKRVAYKVAEIAEMTSLSISYIQTSPDVPKLRGTRKRSPILIPAWALDAFIATGDWWHPDFRPAQFPTNENAPAAVTARA